MERREKSLNRPVCCFLVLILILIVVFALLDQDKNRDNPAKAAEKFVQLQKAYEILSDEKGRAAYIAVWKVRVEKAQKLAQHSEKRRRMMKDLDAREKAYEAARSREEKVKQQFKAEMERIRREMAEKRGRGQQSMQVCEEDCRKHPIGHSIA